MRVKMLQDAPGSPDGATVNEYNEGEVYEVTDALGEVFVQYGLAEETEEVVVHEPIEEVPAGEDAEDKADTKATTPKENK